MKLQRAEEEKEAQEGTKIRFRARNPQTKERLLGIKESHKSWLGGESGTGMGREVRVTKQSKG